MRMLREQTSPVRWEGVTKREISGKHVLAVHKSNWATPEGGKKKPELRGEWKKLKDQSEFCRSRGDSGNQVSWC